MICWPRCGRALLTRRARYFDEEAQILAEVLNEGKDSGELVFGDALSTAYALLHATNSLLPYNLSTTELGERKEVRRRPTQLQIWYCTACCGPARAGDTKFLKLNRFWRGSPAVTF